MSTQTWFDDDFTTDVDFADGGAFDSIDYASDDDDLQTVRTLHKSLRAERRTAQRQYITGLRKEALTELVRELPPPDTDLYIITNGSGGTFKPGLNPVAFEFGHFIPVLADMLDCKGGELYVSTWTMNRAHAQNILENIDNGTFAHVTVMTDPYFMRRESAVASALVTGLLERGQRFLAFKNHVKAMGIATADRSRTVVITGSANLSSQPRAENFVLSTSPELYDWMRTDFFEAMTDARA